MHINQVRARDFKALHEVTIHSEGRRVVIIGGRNAQGKSSVLDAIIAALGGKRSTPHEPVRRGAETGEVEVDVGDLQVLCTFRAEDGKRTVKVQAKDGAKYGQSRLDAIFSDLGPDPLAFIHAAPAKQLEIAKEALGLDLSDLEEEAARVYAERTEVNRTVHQLDAEAAATPRIPDAPPAEVSVEDLIVELDAANVANTQIAQHHSAMASIGARQEEILASVKRDQEQIQRLKDGIAAARAEFEDLARKLEVVQAGVRDAQPIDTSEIRERIKGVEATNRAVRQNLAAAAISERLDAARAESAKLTVRLQEIAQARIDRIASANFPVPGMELTEDGILLNDLPFDQASSAERLRVAVAMGLAMNPELRVFMVRDGSLLDEESLALFDQMAERYDAQFWIERVGDADPGAIVIEAGEVRP